ncbi:hypothetical protein HUG17_0331 [Dermatophagoides farinae]|uniref:Uncharacterized protein n=1 Tax=Dermatophagoides farinae TaxID=6954 RepID=A0A9D4P624_DERFA|nr:hypothetical protein HUG17_0331 [Dermatophagoides farinae]
MLSILESEIPEFYLMKIKLDLEHANCLNENLKSGVIIQRETFVAPSNADDNVRDVPLQANDDDDDDNINVDPLPAIYDN